MSTHTKTITERKAARIKAIKASQRQLFMDNDTYYDMLYQLTGKRSATELSLDEMAKVLNHLRSKGAINPNHGRRRPVPAESREALLAKVSAQLQALTNLTGTTHTLRYADAIVKSRGWGENVDFCDGLALQRLITALNRTYQYKLATAGH